MPNTSSRLGGWSLLTLLTAVSFGAHAQERSTPLMPQPSARPSGHQGARAGRPLSEFLTPDGRLRPGASGSFDPTGYRMGTNPRTGQPTFRTTGAGDEDWQAATGQGIGGGSTVSALAVASNGDLYVGGNFNDAGGNPNADGIFRWDGTSLQTLGTGLSGGVNDIAVASNGDVYVGGQFNDAGGNPDADNIARWDGTSWQALGTGVSGGVYAMAIHNSSVYVVGQFGDAGGTPNTYAVAQWNGTSWQALGGGLNFGGFLGSVAVRANGDVYVGGFFNDANTDTNMDMIARFDGSFWQSVGSGLNGAVDALTIAANGDVVAAGIFSDAGGNPDADRIAHWNGSSWQAYGTGIRGQVYDLLGASNGDVYVAGFFVDNTNTINAYTMRWDGTSWQALNPDVSSYTYAVAEAPNGDIWYGGDFQEAGDIRAPFKVARWNGTSWSAPAIIGLNGRVNALAVASNGDVYVGGLFSNAGGNSDANNVARWDGYQWNSLGTGLNNQVHALAIASNGDVLVGGDFSDAGGNPDADKIARWDGTDWQAFGTGIDGGVYALAVAANGDLYIGGFFDDAGGNANADNVARWDGSSFQALGNGLDNAVAALAVAGPGEVWVGGFFQNAGGNAAADFVTRWNGSSFQALGSGVNGPVEALAANGPGQVYAGSYFTDAGGNPNADHVALWDGTSWQSLGTGLNDQVKALVAGSAGQLYAGGDFTTVGDGSKTLNRFAIHYAQSLIVSSPMLVPAGAYHNITITGTGDATLAGDISISGTLLVQEGGILRTGNGGSCATITGPGEFYMEYNTELHICSPDGITYDAPLGNVQVTGYRYFYDAAKYVYDGTTAQVTGDGLESSVLELEINNAAGVTLTQRVGLYRALRLTSGTLNTAGFRLRLFSYGDYTAYAVHAGGSVNGNVSVQRYIPGAQGVVSYHHLSSPVQNSTVNDLATNGFVPKVNTTYNNLPTPKLSASQMPNVFGFNEARGGNTAAYQGFGIGYFSPATLGTTLTPGRGYSVAIGGDLLPDFVGTLTTGNVDVALTQTGPLTAANKNGWHLLGNCYPQPIDWDLLATPANLQASVYVWYSTGGNNGAYRTRNAGGVGNLTDGLIGIGQGFFVRTNAPTVFPFTNALRVENDAVPLGRTAASTAPRLTLTLAQAGAPADHADAVTVYEQAGATPGFDGAYDAARPGPNVGLPTLSALIDGEAALISALPEGRLSAGTTVELTLTLPAAGDYTLAAAALTNLPGATLLDRLSGTRHDLATQPAVAFTAAQAGEVAGRFALVFGERKATAATATLTLWPNPATAGTVHLMRPATATATATDVLVLDAAGRVVRRATLTAEGTLDVRHLTPGVYAVRVGGATARLVIE